MYKPIRPKKPYSNFSDYLKTKMNSQHELICSKCSGSGRVYDPRSPKCVIEGSKMRDRIDCPLCEGSGIGIREMYKSFYIEIMDEYKAKLEKYTREIALYKSVVKKLSKEEKEYVGIE